MVCSRGESLTHKPNKMAFIQEKTPYGSETINGTTGNDLILWTGGDDLIDGGNGHDVLSINLNSTYFEISTANSGLTYARYLYNDLTLVNIEEIEFLDRTIVVQASNQHNTLNNSGVDNSASQDSKPDSKGNIVINNVDNSFVQNGGGSQSVSQNNSQTITIDNSHELHDHSQNINVDNSTETQDQSQSINVDKPNESDDDFGFTIIGNNSDEIFANNPNADDLIDGKGGTDIVDFSGRDNAINLNKKGAQNTGDGKDTLLNIEAIRAGDGNDLIIGSKNNEVFFGQEGNDSIDGGKGDDFISGGFSGLKEYGDDILFGNKGNDSIYGHGGDDLIEGGKGKDSLYGGDGNDTFIVSLKSGKGKKNIDTIKDFEPGSDFIYIHGSAKGMYLQAHGDDDYLMKGKHLLAVIEGQAGNLDWVEYNGDLLVG